MVTRRFALVSFDSLLILAAFYGAYALRLPERGSLAVAMASVQKLPALAVILSLIHI